MFAAQPGLIVGNRYQLTEVIGRGGMGEVWKAHDRDLDTPCAVKFILQHLAADRGMRQRFTREAKAVARLRSPHVVHILGVGEVEDIPYLAMELLDGETLLARLERIGRLHPVVTMKMVEQVAEALESAHHAGVVHRDLKPDNIWFWSGNKVFIKVLDFGVAKTGMTTESLQTATGALVGTPQYMSPEQALGNRDIDHRSDLWSLAIITIECLSGKRPFDSVGLGDLLLKIVGSTPPSLKELAPELPAALQAWWARALARDPRDRFQSASEFVEALRPHLTRLETEWVAPQALESVRLESVRASRAYPTAENGATTRSTGTPPILLQHEMPSLLSARAALPTPEPLASVRGALGPMSQLPGSQLPGSQLPGSQLPGSQLLGSQLPGYEPNKQPPGDGAGPRSLNSLGPISSSPQSAQRRDARHRTLLIAGTVLAAGLIVTSLRLLKSEPEPTPAGMQAPAARADAVPESTPGAAPTGGEPASGESAPSGAAPSGAAAVNPSEVAPVSGVVRVRPVAEPGPLEQPSPWEPVLNPAARAPNANKPGEAATPPRAAPPRAVPRAPEPARAAPANDSASPVLAKPAAEPAYPSASGVAAGNVSASGAPAGASKASPKAPDPAAKPAGEVAQPGSASPDPAVETEAARKERLRKATGL